MDARGPSQHLLFEAYLFDQSVLSSNMRPVWSNAISLNSWYAWCRLDNLERCQQPATFERVVHQLQLSQSQRTEMLKVRKQWRDYLARSASSLPFLRAD